MTVFEHSFALIGLVLGLALAHVLNELVRAVRTHGLKLLGPLTPLLAIFVILDIGTWWGVLWEMRAMLPNIWPVLGTGLAISCLYYVAAICVFPESRIDWLDLDDYYLRHRRFVLGLMFFCFALTSVLRSLLMGALAVDIVAATYFAVLGLTWLAPWKRANIVGLSGLIAVDAWAFFPA